MAMRRATGSNEETGAATRRAAGSNEETGAVTRRATGSNEVTGTATSQAVASDAASKGQPQYGLVKLKLDVIELESYIPWNAVVAGWPGIAVPPGLAHSQN